MAAEPAAQPTRPSLSFTPLFGKLLPPTHPAARGRGPDNPTPAQAAGAPGATGRAPADTAARRGHSASSAARRGPGEGPAEPPRPHSGG